MQNKTDSLVLGATYHVYNRANGMEKLFLKDENFRYFLQKYQEYISPIADTFAYCLMPNHFHFLIRIKDRNELEAYFKLNVRNDGYQEPIGLNNSEPRTLSGVQDLETLSGREQDRILSRLLSQQFSNLFNGYTQAFNKQQQRKGSLFMRPFKRKLVNSTDYLLKLVQYIHLNPVEAGLCGNPIDWTHSSYPILIGNQESFIKRDEIVNWFQNKENFMAYHLDSIDRSGIET